MIRVPYTFADIFTRYALLLSISQITFLKLNFESSTNPQLNSCGSSSGYTTYLSSFFFLFHLYNTSNKCKLILWRRKIILQRLYLTTHSRIKKIQNIFSWYSLVFLNPPFSPHWDRLFWLLMNGNQRKIISPRGSRRGKLQHHAESNLSEVWDNEAAI